MQGTTTQSLQECYFTTYYEASVKWNCSIF